MSKANPASEPSMEEILASIRRIIADEETAASAPPPPARIEEPIARFDKKEAPRAEAPRAKIPEPEPEPEAEPDVLELTPDDVETAAEGDVEMSQDDITSLFDSPSVDAVDAFEDIQFEEPQPEPEPEPAPAPVAARPAPAPAPSFAPPPMREHHYQPEPAPVPRSYAPQPDSLLSAEASASVSAAFGSLANTFFSPQGRTIEDLTKDLLRPMLQQWLDDNLPPLVEKLVREEIERVARGRR